MPNNTCSWGLCRSDSRRAHQPDMKGVTFKPFPQPKTQPERCMEWIKRCNRPHDQLDVNKIAYYHFVCSKPIIPVMKGLWLIFALQLCQAASTSPTLYQATRRTDCQHLRWFSKQPYHSRVSSSIFSTSPILNDRHAKNAGLTWRSQNITTVDKELHLITATQRLWAILFGNEPSLPRNRVQRHSHQKSQKTKSSSLDKDPPLRQIVSVSGPDVSKLNVTAKLQGEQVSNFVSRRRLKRVVSNHISRNRTHSSHQEPRARLKRDSEKLLLLSDFITSERNGGTEDARPSQANAIAGQYMRSDECECDTLRLDRKRGNGSECPLSCRCERDPGGAITLVDCSDQGLTTIPELPVTSRTVLLDKNDIKKIPPCVFYSLRQLNSLDLSKNKIIDLSSCAFTGLFSLEYLRISETGLKGLPPHVFDCLNKLQQLDLSQNALDSLDHRPFNNLTQLFRLDLSSNNLAQIKNDTFQSLASLTQLYLHLNQLRYLNTTFGANAFVGLRILESLTLHGNEPAFSANFSYPDIALSQVPSLRSLSLDGYPRVMGPGFKKLIRLEKLIFNDKNRYCDMSSRSIPDMFFSNVNTERPLHLDLSFCHINVLPSDLFTYTPTIDRLLLAHNDFGIDGFEKGSYGLRNSNMTYLDISSIQKDFTAIKNTTFQYLRNTKLTTMLVEHNALVTISNQAIFDLPVTLAYLSLERNYIEDGDFLPSLLHLTNLKVLMGSRQISYTNGRLAYSNSPASTPPRNAQKNIPKLSTHILNGQANQDIVSTSPIYEEHSGLITDMTDFCDDSTFLTDRRADQRTVKDFPFPLPPKLEQLFMSDVKLDYDIPAIMVFNKNVLKIIDYSNNNVKCFGGPVRGLLALEYLDLSRNFCLRVSTFMFSQLANLKTLLLYDNVLGPSLTEDTDGKMFSALHKLQILNLHNNALKDLSDAAFIFNPNLQTLNLSLNGLTSFRPNLANNTALEILDVSFNTLAGFTEFTCKQLSDIKKETPEFRVRIRDNSFVCDCSNIAFMTLLLQQPEIFEDIAYFQCLLANGTHIHYVMLESALVELSVQCVLEPIFVCALLAFCLILGTFVVTSVYHHKRWQWTYLYYVGRSRLHIGSSYFNYRPLEHVFVTYDQGDQVCRSFMAREFLPRLRQEGLSLVLGELDFPPGPLTPSICGAVETTRKTLAVLSKDIFENHHRTLEVNLAIMHELHMRRTVLVPVLFLSSDPAPAVDIQSQRSPRAAADAQAMNGSRDCHRTGANAADMDPTALVDQFPPEIATFLLGQARRCLVFDGGSEAFWQSLKDALLAED